MTLNFKKIYKAENWIFLLITILNLIPIFTVKFFPTMDGAAHLYNSNLINSLLFESRLNDFFIYNSEVVPNWTSHFILSILNKFAPAFIAEKVLLIFYFIGLPYAFRGLIKIVNSSNILFSYLIFPFTYSFVFLLGFYNFSIAIIFMFIAIRYWIKHEDNLSSSVKKKIILFLIITLTYFSHILIFAVTLLLIGIRIFSKSTIRVINNPNYLKRNVFIALKEIKNLVVVSILPLILFCYYFYSRPYTGNNIFLEQQELMAWLINLRPIIAYNPSIEEVYTQIIVYCLAILLLIAISKRIIAVGKQLNSFSKKKLHSIIKDNLHVSDLWILATVIFLILYFTLPNSNGSAGFISVRFGLLFFITLIIWLTTQKYPKWVIVLTVVVVLYCNFKLVNYYSAVLKNLNEIAVDCNEASSHIEANSIVLPLNYSNNWIVDHFSNYLGIDKPMIILENYECETDYFPIKWNKNRVPNTVLGNLSPNEFTCVNWISNSSNTKANIDYVFILGSFDKEPDSCNQFLKKIVLDNYNLVYRNENCQLYKIN